MNHDNCSLSPELYADYLSAHKLIFDGLYTIKQTLDLGRPHHVLLAPECLSCKKQLGVRSLKVCWPNEKEVDQEIDGIATTCELLHETGMMEKDDHIKISRRVDRLRHDTTGMRKNNLSPDDPRQKLLSSSIRQESTMTEPVQMLEPGCVGKDRSNSDISEGNWNIDIKSSIAVASPNQMVEVAVHENKRKFSEAKSPVSSARVVSKSKLAPSPPPSSQEKEDNIAEENEMGKEKRSPPTTPLVRANPNPTNPVLSTVPTDADYLLGRSLVANEPMKSEHFVALSHAENLEEEKRLATAQAIPTSQLSENKRSSTHKKSLASAREVSTPRRNPVGELQEIAEPRPIADLGNVSGRYIMHRGRERRRYSHIREPSQECSGRWHTDIWGYCWTAVCRSFRDSSSTRSRPRSAPTLARRART